MNSINNRDWELYNLNSLMKTSEYDNILINKNIENYFNDIISKPVISSNTVITKSNYNFNKFYDEYIEHNLLFIVLLVGIIIFLIIRYFGKDIDNFDLESNLKYTNTKNIPNSNLKISKNINKQKISKQRINNEQKINKQNNNEKTKLIKYKKQLDKEKEKILSIIDELSNLNNYEYLNSDTNTNYTNTNKLKFYNEYEDESNIAHNSDDNSEYYDINNNFNDDTYTNTNKLKFYNEYEYETNIAHNSDDNSEYYDINKNFNDKTNEIDGLYIEPPFA